MDEDSLPQRAMQEDDNEDLLNWTTSPATLASHDNNPIDEWMDILGSGHLKKRVIKKGKSGIRPTRGEICILKVIGKLEDDTVVEENDNLVIHQGDMEVTQVLYKISCYLYYIHIFLNISLIIQY